MKTKLQNLFMAALTLAASTQKLSLIHIQMCIRDRGYLLVVLVQQAVTNDKWGILSAFIGKLHLYLEDTLSLIHIFLGSALFSLYLFYEEIFRIAPVYVSNAEMMISRIMKLSLIHIQMCIRDRDKLMNAFYGIIKTTSVHFELLLRMRSLKSPLNYLVSDV